MTAKGDVIQPGQTIPEDVTGVDDIQCDGWTRVGALWALTRHAGELAEDLDPSPARFVLQFTPLTVTAVREQPAEPERKLIGPPHAHLDAPCTDACYEPVAPQPAAESVPDVLDLVRQYGDERENVGAATPNRGELNREMANAAVREANALFAQIEAEVQRLRDKQAWLYRELLAITVQRDDPRHLLAQVMAELGVDRPEDVLITIKKRAGALTLAQNSRKHWLDKANDRQAEIEQLQAIVKKRDREIDAAQQSAESGPLRLSLPPVPEGAVALVGERTGKRYPRRERTAFWQDPERGGATTTLAEVLEMEDPGGVTVEMAPPREPRTWKQYAINTPLAPANQPDCVTVQGWGTYGQREDGLYANTDGYPDDVGRESCHTFDSLRALGDVTEVLDA